MGKRIGKLVGVVAFLLCFWKVPLFAVSDIPDEDAWVTNGPVYAVVRDEKKGITYIGGSFSYVGPNTGCGVPIDTETGEPVSKFPRVNGEIYAVVFDGSGGWYIGGCFTKVGKEERYCLAHIKNDGTVDKDWDPNADGSVYALAVSGDGKTLYVGGCFTEIGGQYRSRIAALDINTGEPTDWNPGANDWVEALVISGDGETLYVGGGFNEIGDETRNCLASFDISTGKLTNWDPNANDWVEALAVSGGILYVGGYFTEIDDETRNCLASFDITGVTPTITEWNPNVDDWVAALAVSGGILYVGGYFTEIDDETRNCLASFDISTGNLTEWAPNVISEDYYTVVEALVVSDGILYVGGRFTEIGGQYRRCIAALDINTGEPTDWNPGAAGAVEALAVSSDGETLYVGGGFGFTGGKERNNIAALDSNGKLTDWDPNADWIVNALAVSSDGETLYVGGGFNEIGGETRNCLASFNITGVTPTITEWDPNVDDRVEALAVSSDGETLYVGGRFTEIGGQYRRCIAALDASTGVVIEGWNPGAYHYVNALAVSSDGETLYVGGRFTEIGGQYRRCIAALDASTGVVIEGWNPGANDGVYALAVSDGILYVGGYFTEIDDETRNCLASFDISTGKLTNWDPNANDWVKALAVSGDGKTLYLGGCFTEIGGQYRSCIAAFDINTGEPTDWNPGVNGPVVYSLAVSNNGSVYVGGWFTTIGGDIFPHYAQFSGSISPLMKGDINEDGEIDISDVILCLRMALGLPVTIQGETYTSYPDSLVNCANINRDEGIDISDVILCLRMALGLPITINGQTYDSPYDDL